MFPIVTMLPKLPRVKIVDVGAMSVGEGTDAYYRLAESLPCELIGFEPVAAECEKLNTAAKRGYKYFPYFIGDGSTQTFYECAAVECSSLLEPNAELVARFTRLDELMRVVATRPVLTKRLDDIPEAAGTDYLKLDVQGGELMVLKGAVETMRNALVIHTEVEFAPLYRDQPLFGDIDAHLRAQGFALHKIAGVGGAIFKPMQFVDENTDVVNQMLWCDVIYVRDYLAFEQMSAEQLLKLGAIMHENYCSFDLVAAVLAEFDRKTGSTLQARYLRRLSA